MNLPPRTDDLSDLLREHIQKRIAELIEEECKAVVERVHQRVRAEVGSIASTVLERFTMERNIRELVIRVDLSPAPAAPPVTYTMERSTPR